MGQEHNAKMVDISAKSVTDRTAVAVGKLTLKPETLAVIKENKLSKGDVITVAKTAAIMGAKKTPGIIPLCHPIAITGTSIDIEINDPNEVIVRATVKTTDKTGVEMEALTAVSIACLTIYDMTKPIDKGIVIGPIYLESKTGGKSGEYKRLKAED